MLKNTRLGMSMAGVVIFVMGAVGCGTQTIHQHYRTQLSKIAPGMELMEFNQTMPDAYVAGQNTVGGKRIDAYEVQHMHDDYAHMQTINEKLWFYFSDGRLVKWGRPQDWPTPADLVVEVRNR